jgi:hypothetical protein
VKVAPVALALVLIGACGACRDSTTGIRTEFVGSYAFSATERRTIARVAGLAARDARQHLPALASQLTLQVRSGTDVIPELGATAVAGLRDWVQWTVDPDRPEGVVKIAETHLRGALFHEFHHLVRGSTIVSTTLMDWRPRSSATLPATRAHGRTIRPTCRRGWTNSCCSRRRQTVASGCRGIQTAAAGLDSKRGRIWLIGR